MFHVEHRVGEVVVLTVNLRQRDTIFSDDTRRVIIMRRGDHG
jgi:hypothetical protein